MGSGWFGNCSFGGFAGFGLVRADVEFVGLAARLGSGFLGFVRIGAESITAKLAKRNG